MGISLTDSSIVLISNASGDVGFEKMALLGDGGTMRLLFKWTMDLPDEEDVARFSELVRVVNTYSSLDCLK